MPPSHVELTEQEDLLVNSLVQSGRFQSARDVVGASLRLLENAQRREEERIQVLKAAADKGWADIAAGRYYDIEDKDLDSFMEQIEAEVDEAMRSQG